MTESILGLAMEEIARDPIPADVTYITLCLHADETVTIGVIVGLAGRGGVFTSENTKLLGFRGAIDVAIAEARRKIANSLTAEQIAAAEFGALMPALR